ncbi:MAG: hypothetical protein J6S67_15555 [Methanobrevibacter sp.]|nr:hypothetical protein [Methanobrevibacter sp.]
MILICGIPNAGKTTYSSLFKKVIHCDDVTGRNQLVKIVAMVKDDPEICVEGVYEKAEDRKKLVDACSKKSKCIWLDTPLDECIKREINGRNRSVHMVQWSSEDFEPPTYDEGWDEIEVIKYECV